MPGWCELDQSDKFRHCLASCRADKICGTVSAAAIGILKELTDEVREWSNPAIDALPLPKPIKEMLKGSGWDWEDIKYDALGLACANEKCCGCLACCCHKGSCT